MRPFTRLTARAAPLMSDNVDTDQIFPKQFLSTVAKEGLAYCLFHDWRFDEEGSRRPDFILNQSGFEAPGILVAGRNFGCGSSREHAPWALADFGIRCIVAEGFADIFHNNCLESGILAIVLEPDRLSVVAEAAAVSDNLIEVDLIERVIRLEQGRIVLSFDIPESKRARLLAGLNSVGETLRHEEDIDAFEVRRSDGL